MKITVLTALMVFLAYFLVLYEPRWKTKEMGAYTFRFPSCNFMIAVPIIQALGKCVKSVKSVLHIAAI